MLFRETVAVYCENHMEHTDTLCGQNADFLIVKAVGIHNYHCASGHEIRSVPYYTGVVAADVSVGSRRTEICSQVVLVPRAPRPLAASTQTPAVHTSSINTALCGVQLRGKYFYSR
jgi:hypothetical protein